MALEAAKRHLIENYLVVGYTERLSDLIPVLERLLPRFFAGATNHYKGLTGRVRPTLRYIAPFQVKRPIYERRSRRWIRRRKL